MKGQAFAPAAIPTVITMPEPTSTFEPTLQNIYNQISQRAYDLFSQRGYQHGSHLDDWLRAESELLQPTPIEIVDDDNVLTVRAEVPGFSPKDLEVKIEPSRLMVRGQTEQSKRTSSERTLYSERESKQVFRVLNLPTKVNAEKASAKIQDGVLHIVLPKATTASVNNVEVKAA